MEAVAEAEVQEEFQIAKMKAVLTHQAAAAAAVEGLLEQGEEQALVGLVMAELVETLMVQVEAEAVVELKALSGLELTFLEMAEVALAE